MPYYKIAYSIAFVVILSAIQPVVYANEIGQAVERAVSLLAVVFCADTYIGQGKIGVLHPCYNKFVLQVLCFASQREHDMQRLSPDMLHKVESMLSLKKVEYTYHSIPFS